MGDLTVGTLVYALDPTTKLIKLKLVTKIERVPFDGELVALETKRADLRVAPDHRIPYCTKANTEVRFKRADSLHERAYYKFINDWRRRPGRRLDTVDITDFVDDYEISASFEEHGHTVRAALPDGCEPVRNNGHTGYHFDAETFKQYQTEIEAIAEDVTIRHGPNHHRRPYRFDGDDFIQFLGWFVTEGSVHWSKSSDTAQVKLAQNDDRYRQSIRDLLERMGLLSYSNESYSGFSSKVFGRLFEALCGRGSHNKRLPQFVWDLHEDQQRLLLDVLLCGDGNDRQTYYTASTQLANDVLRLCLELGIKPRYSRRRGVWQIYVRTTKDGFNSTKHVQSVRAEGDLYRLTVADYCTVIAGRNGKYQWVGVSGVS
ncbi:LAGLIDADG family homing endonuclease [Halorussus halophilus]|uniref:LAGLIDADG family homing endonuclease n=1 Tax=Halorussus halophilus TaxID=2650975 RepID=UPI0017885665|nr:LAGLIDADG family homing endonuclease [Halorussus halophilus]